MFYDNKKYTAILSAKQGLKGFAVKYSVFREGGLKIIL